MYDYASFSASIHCSMGLLLLLIPSAHCYGFAISIDFSTPCMSISEIGKPKSSEISIVLTWRCDVDPLTPHFHTVKLGFTVVYIYYYYFRYKT